MTVSSDEEKIAQLMEPLGLHHKRAQILMQFSSELVHNVPWTEDNDTLTVIATASHYLEINLVWSNHYSSFCVGQESSHTKKK